MSEIMYSKALLRLAAQASGAGRLPEPKITCTEHNPTCGDRCTVDMHVEAQRILAIAHETKACVLTQASATILAENLIGATYADLVSLKAQIIAMLQGGATPDHPFAAYEVLRAAATTPARHRCVLLPLEAALKALASVTPRQDW